LAAIPVVASLSVTLVVFTGTVIACNPPVIGDDVPVPILIIISMAMGRADARGLRKNLRSVCLILAQYGTVGTCLIPVMRFDN